MRSTAIDFHGNSMGMLYFNQYLNNQSQSAIKTVVFYRHFQGLHKDPHLLTNFSAELNAAQFRFDKHQTCKLLSECYCKPLF